MKALGQNLAHSINRADMVSDPIGFSVKWVKHISTNKHPSGLSALLFNGIHQRGVCIMIKCVLNISIIPKAKVKKLK